MLWTEDSELTLNAVKKPKIIKATIATRSPKLSTALFSMLNRKKLFFELPIELFNGCFIL